MIEKSESGNAEPGDPFEAIVQEFYEPLFRFAMSLTQSRADACDLTQQTFYVWATKGHQLRDLSKVKTWLFTTLHRMFLDACRRENRFVHEELEEASGQLPAVLPKITEQLDGSEVLAGLARVDGKYQAAVALFYLEDCSYKDIAAILDVPIGTVKSRIARGIAQLRKILMSDDSAESSSNQDGVASAANDGEPAAHSEDSSSRSHIRRDVRVDESEYEEWDLSATFLPEQTGLI